MDELHVRLLTHTFSDSLNGKLINLSHKKSHLSSTALANIKHTIVMAISSEQLSFGKNIALSSLNGENLQNTLNVLQTQRMTIQF